MQLVPPDMHLNKSHKLFYIISCQWTEACSKKWRKSRPDRPHQILNRLREVVRKICFVVMLSLIILSNSTNQILWASRTLWTTSDTKRLARERQKAQKHCSYSTLSVELWVSLLQPTNPTSKSVAIRRRFTSKFYE